MPTVDEILKSGRVSPDYDPDQHLEAIKSLVARLRVWQRECGERVKTSIDDCYVDACVDATYADAACSHAIVGALAPFFEGMFHHEFAFLRFLFDGKRPAVKLYRRHDIADDDIFWNPARYVEKDLGVSEKDNICVGTIQLTKSLGMDFPRQFFTVIEALFAYRNSALHGGYEWLKERRAKFKRLVESQKWTDWFAWAEAGGNPWIAYLTDAFVDECFAMAPAALDVFEQHRLDQLDKLPRPSNVPEWLLKYVADDHSLDELRLFLRRRRSK